MADTPAPSLNGNSSSLNDMLFMHSSPRFSVSPKLTGRTPRLCTPRLDADTPRNDAITISVPEFSPPKQMVSSPGSMYEILPSSPMTTLNNLPQFSGNNMSSDLLVSDPLVSMNDSGIRAHLTPMLEVEMAKIATNNSCPLSRPIFRADGLLVTGVEATPQAEANFVLAAMLDLSEEKPAVDVIWNIPIREGVRDITWLDSFSKTTIAIALERSIIVLRLPDGNSGHSCLDGYHLHSDLPQIHDDWIRTISASPLKPGLLASGGFDEKLEISEINGKDGESKTVLSHNARGIISCVEWHPVEEQTVTLTTDDGHLQLVDLRTGSVELMYDFSRRGCYSHQYLPENPEIILAGFANGGQHFFDRRRCSSIMTSEDPFVADIGDIVCSGKRQMYNGTKGFSIYELAHQGSNLYQRSCIGWGQPSAPQVASEAKMTNPLQEMEQWTSGCFLNDDAIAVTDSSGNLSLYALDQAKAMPGLIAL
eukprot:TRINITY_DN773030_c0_g1_i1.p1 TRINITY_DN773030_c0_g1~~TRINITY_DN773030_c0_g1_i1.p1  ORF type:complete len:479 (-),score=91.88 TRINITY_DN773030_c0_g1_i1:3-1439(-)